MATQAAKRGRAKALARGQDDVVEDFDHWLSYSLSDDAKAEDTQLSGKDAQALEWANANPNDPRAAKIKARIGAE